MKAEHYIKSGLNGVPTSVMRLTDCIAVAAGELTISPDSERAAGGEKKGDTERAEKGTRRARSMNAEEAGAELAPPNERPASFSGRGLPSQGDFTIEGEAFVTDAPITFLGYVNRQTGVIEEADHPADGQSLAGKVAIFPRGTGSSVAPYVLLELHYRGVGPLAIVNSEIDQQTVPACSLEGIPYAYGFEGDVTRQVRSGDRVRLSRRGAAVTLTVLEPSYA
jgi:predicted aconitase with swiveling domain